MPIEQLDNYLNITLVNSNPLLHTARLFSIYKDYPTKNKEYSSLPLFYENWDIETSKLLIAMDEELFAIFDSLKRNGIYVEQIKPIVKHYESLDEIGLTNKILSINSLKGLTTPSIKNENGNFIPDFSSRYFSADFPYGLEIIIEFAKITNTACPNMQLVDNWYRFASNNPDKGFTMIDNGIKTIDDLLDIYCSDF